MIHIKTLTCLIWFTYAIKGAWAEKNYVVEDVTVLERTSENIALRWHFPESVKACRIFMEEDKSIIKTIETSRNNINFTDLQPCSTYSLTWTSYQAGASLDNFTLNIQTLSAVPGEVINFSAHITSSKSLFGNWTAPVKAYKCIKSYFIRIIRWDSFVDSVVVGRDENSFNIVSIMSCADYEVSIQVVGEENLSSQVVKKKFSTIPADVKDHTITNVAVNNQSIEKVTITWDADKSMCINDYLVSYFDGYSNKAVVTNSSKIVISNLEACTKYYVTIYARSATKDFIGQTRTVVAGSKVLVPGPVKNIDSIQYSGHNVLLTWDEPSENPLCVSKYRITWNQDYTADTNTTQCMLAGLQPCTTYAADVSAVNEEKAVGTSNREFFMTLNAQPGPVEELTIKDAGSGSAINISWNEPTYAINCVQFYRVKICDREDHAHCFIDTTGNLQTKEGSRRSATSYYKTDIRACVQYDILVTPVSALGDAKAVAQTYTSPARVFKPKLGGSATEIGADSVTFSWPIEADVDNACVRTSYAVKCSTFELGPVTVIRNMTINVDKQNTIINIFGLQPFTRYSCVAAFDNKAGRSPDSNSITFQTEQSVPSPPVSVNIAHVKKDKFSVTWKPPTHKNGIIVRYRIVANSTGLNYDIASKCKCVTSELIDVYVARDVLRYEFVNLKPREVFSVIVYASTVMGFGEPSDPITVITEPAEPEKVRELRIDTKYEQNRFILKWKQPCCTNGFLSYFEISVSGDRKGHENHMFEEIVPADNENLGTLYALDLLTLRPEYLYRINVTAVGEHGKFRGKAEVTQILVPATIPLSPKIERVYKALANDSNGGSSETTQVKIVLPFDLFDDSSGDILYYAVIVSRYVSHNKVENGMLNCTADWPYSETWAFTSQYDFLFPYQATPIRWMPFTEGQEAIEYIIGENTSCTIHDKYFCNGPLKPDTRYKLKIRAFTRSGYQDTVAVFFSTGLPTMYGLYIAATVTIIILITVILAYVIRNHRLKNSFRTLINMKKSERLQEEKSTYPPPDIRISKFPEYCERFLSSPNIIKIEFEALSKISASMAPSVTVAQLPQNQVKNRYKNVLPYDRTRVRLPVINGSDYINASLVQSYDRDYIACQAPKAETFNDFWRMIIMYDVSTIVMLCRTLEKGKTCEKYYPEQNGTVQYGEITITCVNVVKSTYVTLRTLSVVYKENRRSVQHIHFQNWPDFSVPASPKILVDFCYMVNRLASPGIVTIHCSAGVGRTGTFIACDIILKHLKESKTLNIFNIVLKLREDRMCMVQSEVQYKFLYECAVYVLKIRNSPTASSDINVTDM